MDPLRNEFGHYERLGGLSVVDFLDIFWDKEVKKWIYPQNDGFEVDLVRAPISKDNSALVFFIAIV